MAIDVSRFRTSNVADTCALWNVLSSKRLYTAARQATCSFCCTAFVLYECLYKKRTAVSREDEELKARLRAESTNNEIISYSLEIADLQEVAVLESRKRLSKGELSSIVFAKRTSQAFLTDDQKARKLSVAVLASGMTQTTPHLFGWLFFTAKLLDSDKDQIIEEHKQLNRPLSKYFEEIYLESLRCRLMAHMPYRSD